MVLLAAHNVLGNLLVMHVKPRLLLLVPAGRHGLTVHLPASVLFCKIKPDSFLLSTKVKEELWVTREVSAGDENLYDASCWNGTVGNSS